MKTTLGRQLYLGYLDYELVLARAQLALKIKKKFLARRKKRHSEQTYRMGKEPWYDSASNLETCLGRWDALMMSNSVALPLECAWSCIRALDSPPKPECLYGTMSFCTGHSLRQEAAWLYSCPGHRQQLLAAAQRCEIYEGPLLSGIIPDAFRSYLIP